MYQSFSYSSSDGLTLCGRKYGWENKDPSPVVCLAGLTRNSSDFDDLAKFLVSNEGGERRVLTFDYRGRGQSDHDANWENYNILTEADDVIAGLTAMGLDHVNLIGTSRGGLIAMVLAASRPGALKSVILNDIGPELNGPGLVRIRRNMEKARSPQNLEDAAELLKQQYGHSFPGLNNAGWLEQAAIAYTTNNGKLEATYDKNLLKTLRSINIDVPLASMWPQFKALSAMPLILIHGALSDLLTDDIVKEMANTNSSMKIHRVENEGHAPLLKDDATLRAIGNFLKPKK